MPVILGCGLQTNIISSWILVNRQHHSQQSILYTRHASCKDELIQSAIIEGQTTQVIYNTGKNTSGIPVDIPEDVHLDFVHIINNHKTCFLYSAGKITAMEHVIDTGEAASINIPPCPIQFYYIENVHN